jgi:hypothetical protein
MNVRINKGNQKEKNPVVVCDYNVNMLGVDQLLQPYLLE